MKKVMDLLCEWVEMTQKMHIAHMFGPSHETTPRACKAMDEEGSTWRRAFVGIKKKIACQTPPPSPKKGKIKKEFDPKLL